LRRVVPYFKQAIGIDLGRKDHRKATTIKQEDGTFHTSR